MNIRESSLYAALSVFERMECNLQHLLSEDEAFAMECTYGDLLNIMKQVAQGVIRSHKNGFVYDTLDPQYVQISREPRGDFLVKIMDFGIRFKWESTPGSYIPTLLRKPFPYRAPELAIASRFTHNRSRITAEANVYSFGMFMFLLY